MADYDDEEQKERLILKRYFNDIKCNDYVLSPIGSKKPWDAMFVHKNQHYILELKCLNVNHDTYDSILLELYKAKSLIFEKFKLNIKSKILYMLHYQDNYLRLLEITPSILAQDLSWISNETNKPVYLIDNANCKIKKFV